MELSDPSLFRFIDLIYETVEDPRQWRNLYDQLCTAIGAGSIHMLGMDKRHDTMSYSDGANLDQTGELAYMQRFRHIDPRVPIILRNEVGQWMHCHEELDEEEAGGHRVMSIILHLLHVIPGAAKRRPGIHARA